MQVVIANRLRDGRVVFLGEDGSWVDFLADAQVAPDSDQGQLLMARAQDSVATNEVVDPMLIDVVQQDGTLRAKKNREAIRATGPTVRRDLGKQAEA